MWMQYRGSPHFERKALIIHTIAQPVSPSPVVHSSKKSAVPVAKPGPKRGKHPKRAESIGHKTSSSILDIPAPVVFHKTVEPPISPSYQGILVHALQQKLQLPEVGEVRVRLTFSSSGEICKIEILDAKSSKNADWLKAELPRISLPEPRDYGIVEPILECTVTFQNEECS
jgi:hypothetical protein